MKYINLAWKETDGNTLKHLNGHTPPTTPLFATLWPSSSLIGNDTLHRISYLSNRLDNIDHKWSKHGGNGSPWVCSGHFKCLEVNGSWHQAHLNSLDHYIDDIAKLEQLIYVVGQPQAKNHLLGINSLKIKASDLRAFLDAFLKGCTAPSSGLDWPKGFVRGSHGTPGVLWSKANTAFLQPNGFRVIQSGLHAFKDADSLKTTDLSKMQFTCCASWWNVTLSTHGCFATCGAPSRWWWMALIAAWPS